MGFLKKHFGHGKSSANEAQNDSSQSAGGSSSQEKQSTYSSQRDEKRDPPPETQYAPPPGPPPGRQPASSRQDDGYAPPPGPPPGWQAAGSKRDEDYAPPSGPPPGWQSSSSKASEEHAPPPGPPPGWQSSTSKKQEEEYAPPPGPPPNYHDWQSAVPDTSLLPPPPAISNDFSPTSNASNDAARKAWDWGKKYPLRAPARPGPQFTAPSRAGDVALQGAGILPQQGTRLMEVRSGVWSGRTARGAGDQCFLTNIPLYFALSEDAPKLTGRTATFYFEAHLTGVGAPDRDGNAPSLAIGYAATPYPTWRMPGWERGSLAVHSDDGRRYVNNQDGGLDFVQPFDRPDVVVGLGVRYWVDSWGGGPVNSLKGEVFFTRNGRLEDGWSLQEEADLQTNEYGNWGVAGDHDLFGAVGTYGEVAFKAVFKSNEWLFRPETLPPPRDK